MSNLLLPDSGNAWWFHSELTYVNDLVDLPPLPTKNVIQWIPFGTHDVSQLENAYEEYLKGAPHDVTEEFLKKDELEVPERFVKVKCDTRQYLKVDLERMKMAPIFWQGEEYFVRRATWFLVPENAKITEGFPVERGLEHLLTQRYDETLHWINKTHSELLEFPSGGGDDTIVEKIVSLVPEESGDPNEIVPVENITPPQIQLHDPQAPGISRYFLVFRQGRNDYARLCVEKKAQPNGKRGKDSGAGMSKGGTPLMALASDTVNSGMVLDAPAVIPLDSVVPMSATSTVLSASVSATDLNELHSDSGHLRQDSHNSWMSGGSSASSGSPVSAVGASSPGPQTTTANGSYHSFRLYRTYASFYHSIASGIEKGGAPRVQTQRQTSELEAGEALKESKNKKTPAAAAATASTNNPALDAALAWKVIKAQVHTFRGHPLPSPEIPCETEAPVAVKHAIFAVHGVGQRAFRKMGFHFNKDCDELRNVILDAAQMRGLPTGSVVVFPVSWRAELTLAGNFSFGDDEDSDSEIENVVETKIPDLNTLKSSSPKVDRDLQELSDSFNAGLDATSAPFQRAVSVFQGQFTEIFERLALESIPAVRSVLSDAIMDILLYVSQKHFKKIMAAVVKEVIRQHKLFTHWHPQYDGEFSFLGHSLGSALVADLLSYTVQPDELLKGIAEDPARPPLEIFAEKAEGNFLPFKIDKFFAFGSPLGIFHLLKHTKPIGCLRSPNILSAIAERSRKWRSARRRPGGEDVQDVPDWTIYNCRLFYNVFHPHDPVAHRFESLSLPRSRPVPINKDANSVPTPTGSILPPPLKIPYHKSGLTRFKMDVEAKIARAKDDWAKLTFKLPTWLGGSGGEKEEEKKEDGEDQGNEKDPIDDEGAATSALVDDNPLAAFNHHFRRVDFSLQDSVMENPYISALGAHFVYWNDLDIAAFIVSELIKKEAI